MKTSASRLVSEFADSVLKQRQAIHSGTTRQAKYYGNKREPIARKLLQMGEEGQREFAVLLRHPDREIRAMAAVYLITSMTEEALAVFRELAQGDDLVAMGAQLRIKEWEEHPEHYDESNWAR